jgi:hypothetical protein
MGAADFNADKYAPAEPFPSKQAALDWAMSQGAFGNPLHAGNAYEKVKRDHDPKSAAEMAALWRAEVAIRLAKSATGDDDA